MLNSYLFLMINFSFECSPSVLDRLNALLEPGGVLTMSERGVIDGTVPTITPHPNFRCFAFSAFFNSFFFFPNEW